jgi:urocanate hydratase
MLKKVSIEHIFDSLPEKKPFQKGIRRAPKRSIRLSEADMMLALKNALRYIPKKWHDILAPEFMDELIESGRIYGYRFRPQGNIFGKAIESYQGKSLAGKAIQVMIDNNLDFEVALYPYELVTYGETGQVCQNWMQYQIIKKYLEIIEDNMTLVLMSGHPLGLFSSTKNAPRMMITNGLMVGMYDDQESFQRAAAIGVANYGQMTAGGMMYIGPQGIVHGTYSTLINAGRLKLNLKNEENLKGKLFVSSGLGGMSGAQGKATEIAGGVAIIAEVDPSRIVTRHAQGWINTVVSSPKEAFIKASQAQEKGEPLSIAYEGNIVDLLSYAHQHNIHIDLLSDQTSCHAVYDGGYCPQALSFSERTAMLEHDPEQFKKLVDESLGKHFYLIEQLVSKGTYFFDYGNSFLKACYDAGVHHVCKNKINDLDGFIYPSYVEDIMGPILFDYGYGPFRWVCLSNKQSDLDLTDQAAMEAIDQKRRFQDLDNYNWVKNAKQNKLVVGTKARILYQDAYGRLKIALKFNEMVRNQMIGPIMLGRDHHDTGGTDSPFRETANIKDGSNIMADMATQVALGNSARGMTMVALHNGGGVGIGKSINGGYGMLLDGSLEVDEIIKTALIQDVMIGVGRRSWARNQNAIETVNHFNEVETSAHIQVPSIADDQLIKQIVSKKLKGDDKK